MPNYRNSIKKKFKTLLHQTITVDGKAVKFYESFCPESEANSTLIFMDSNISSEEVGSKTRRVFNVTAPIYINYRGTDTSKSDELLNSVENIVSLWLNSNRVVDGYTILQSRVTTDTTTASDEKGKYIQHRVTCSIMISE